MKVVVVDADAMADVLFYGQFRVKQHSQITDNVDWFHNYGTDGERVVVTGKTTKHCSWSKPDQLSFRGVKLQSLGCSPARKVKEAVNMTRQTCGR